MYACMHLEKTASMVKILFGDKKYWKTGFYLSLRIKYSGNKLVKKQIIKWQNLIFNCSRKKVFLECFIENKIEIRTGGLFIQEACWVGLGAFNKPSRKRLSILQSRKIVMRSMLKAILFNEICSSDYWQILLDIMLSFQKNTSITIIYYRRNYIYISIEAVSLLFSIPWQNDALVTCLRIKI